MKHTDKVMAKKNKKPTINDLLEDMESMMEFVNDIGNKSIEEFRDNFNRIEYIDINNFITELPIQLPLGWLHQEKISF